MPLIQISNDLKVKVSSAHLWFEEALHGDKSIELNTKVYGPIDDASSLVREQLSQIQRIDPALYSETSGSLHTLISKLQEWRRQTSKRWNDRAHSGPGSESDALYDTTFDEILQLCDENKRNIDTLVAHRKEMLSWVQGGLIIFLFIVFAGLTAIFVRYRRTLMHDREMKILGQVASGVAHEVRNPLNAILAVSEAMIQDFADQPESAEYLNRIRNQVRHLSTLMNDLLELGKPIPPSTMRLLPLTDVCRSSIELWKQSHPNAVHKVHLVESKERSKVVLNRAKFQQVFVNLLDNAAEHSPEGSEIRLTLHEPENGAVRLSILDHGPGVSRENIDKIFQPFFTTRKMGTGLGLSIVKHIVEKHGGSINAKNNGSPPGFCVEIKLPLAKDSQHEATDLAG